MKYSKSTRDPTEHAREEWFDYLEREAMEESRRQHNERQERFMEHQLSLFENDPIGEAFLKFHQSNPHIYNMLLNSAKRIRARGVQRWGMKNLWEKLRYDLAIDTNRGDEAYRLNNNYTAYYARLIMRNNPEFEGWFETRGNVELPQEPTHE